MCTTALILAPGCGEDKKKAEGEAAAASTDVSTPDALVKRVVALLKDGKLEPLKGLAPTQADIDEVNKKTGDEAKAGTQEKLAKKVVKGFTKILKKAKEAKVDWSKVELGAIETEENERKGMIRYRINAALKQGKTTLQLRLRATKTERGFVLIRRPRIDVTGGDDLCGRVLANMAKRAEASTDESAGLVKKMLGEKEKMLKECRKALESKPERKTQMECQATAATLKEIMACKM